MLPSLDFGILDLCTVKLEAARRKLLFSKYQVTSGRKANGSSSRMGPVRRESCECNTLEFIAEQYDNDCGFLKAPVNYLYDKRHSVTNLRVSRNACLNRDAVRYHATV